MHGRRSFEYPGAQEWNKLLLDIKLISNIVLSKYWLWYQVGTENFKLWQYQPFHLAFWALLNGFIKVTYYAPFHKI